eukprot:765940-Hanusia_phi.AAC.1
MERSCQGRRAIRGLWCSLISCCIYERSKQGGTIRCDVLFCSHVVARCFFSCRNAARTRKARRTLVCPLVVLIFARPLPSVLEHVGHQVVKELILSRIRLASVSAATSPCPLLLNDAISLLRYIATDFLMQLEQPEQGGGASSWQVRVLESILRELKQGLVDKQEGEHEDVDGEDGEDEGEEEESCCYLASERRRKFLICMRVLLSQTVSVFAAIVSRKAEGKPTAGGAGGAGNKLELFCSFLSVAHRAQKLNLVPLPLLLPCVLLLLRSWSCLEDRADSLAIFLRRKTISFLLQSESALEDGE